MKHKSQNQKKKILKVLNNVRKYSFCKAHALSYAQLVWQLAYQKAHHPKLFWKSTLKNVETCYRKWVHQYEAKCQGVSVSALQKGKSIYAVHRQRHLNQEILTQYQQLQKYGFWNMKDDTFYQGCYLEEENNTFYYKGLIASSRVLNYGKKKKMVLFLGVNKHHYIEVLVLGNIYFDNRKIIMEGKGQLVNKLYGTIQSNSKDVSFI